MLVSDFEQVLQYKLFIPFLSKSLTLSNPSFSPASFKMVSVTSLISALCLATAASAATHDINVGKSGLTFDPDTTTAAVGDSIVFHFFPGPHGAAQGDFSSPCQPLSNGFYSGFIATSSGEASDKFTVMVNSTDPIYIYCPQIGHCQAGMVAAINPP